MSKHSFNIRAYALCINENSVLALHEYYAGTKLLKLPGGGLEYGEGLLECVKRELMEELNLEVGALEHFYTQEDFLESRFGDNEQLLTVYYTTTLKDISKLKILDDSIEKVEWVSLLKENPFTLPIDRLVFDKLKKSL